MGHPQLTTPMQVENSTCDEIMTQKNTTKTLQGIIHAFYWVIDRSNQKHFVMFWKPQVRNLGGCFTKHHSSEHHKGMIPVDLNCLNIRQASARICY